MICATAGNGSRFSANVPLGRRTTVLEDEVRPVTAEPDDLLSDPVGPPHVVVPDGPHATGRLHRFAPHVDRTLGATGPGWIRLECLAQTLPRYRPGESGWCTAGESHPTGASVRSAGTARLSRPSFHSTYRTTRATVKRSATELRRRSRSKSARSA